MLIVSIGRYKYTFKLYARLTPKIFWIIYSLNLSLGRDSIHEIKLHTNLLWTLRGMIPRPTDYESVALTNWAKGPIVEVTGLEPVSYIPHMLLFYTLILSKWDLLGDGW